MIRVMPANVVRRAWCAAIGVATRVCAVGVVALGSVAVVPAAAQVEPVEPYYAVTRAETALRSGDFREYYAVAQLEPGRVLRVDAEGNGWARVHYPEGVRGVAKAADVRDLGDGRLEVVKKTPLGALSAARGFAGSWTRLVPPGHELEPGARLVAIEPVRRPDGRVDGYLIEPPEAARAFVELAALRRATAAEVAALVGEVASPSTSPQTNPSTTSPAGQPTAGATAPSCAARSGPATPSDQPTPVLPTAGASPEPAAGSNLPPAAGSGDSGAGEPASEEPAAAPPAVGEASLLEPMVLPGQPASPAVGSAPGSEAPDLGRDEAQPGLTAAAPPAAADTPAAVPVATPMDELAAEVRREQLTIAQLESAFEAVRRQPAADAELEELIAEFQRVMADPELAATTRDALRRRVDVLRLQADLRDRARAFDEKRAALREREGEVAARVAAAKQTGGYLLVGRLVPSLVYDGTRVPLMYRVVSVGSTAPRTLAYLQPDDRFELASKVGRVVGVSGSEFVDPTLRLRVLTPARVDVLRADAGVP